MSIRVLPKVLADKIAAGEVIERPASVVKELAENSIDAGASRIEVALEDGGAKLIRVVDDGVGMSPSDAALAFLSHSTSKLEHEDDLFDVRTMGFRGEALSSIAAVSQARLVSRPPDSDSGFEVRAEGGEISDVKACGAPLGTQVEVRNLFYNVPVRRKFLRSPATEMAHVTEAVTRLALAHPERAFVLTHNGRSIFNLPPTEDRALRIGEFFGREIADNIIPLRERHPEVEIEGYLLPPSVDRANAAMQYTYVNRRYVRDRTLMHAIGEAYRGLMMQRRRPVCFLFLTVDPAELDVNVHPSKIEVKFRQSREIHSRLLGAVRETLRRASLTPQVTLSQPEQATAGDRTDSIRGAIADFFAARHDAPDHSPAPHTGGSGAPVAPPAAQHAVPGAPPQPAAPQVRYGNTMQVLDSYIVEEAPEGVRLIDQHALHERIIYSTLQRRLKEGPVVSQRLLVPDLVELPKAELSAVLELKDDLARFGMELEAFGDDTIIVRSFPQVLRRFDGRSFFRDLLDELEGPEGARRVDGRVEKLLIMIACRGAVKAGERLGPQQIRGLLEQRAEVDQCDTCPHGRPISILLTREELQRHFRRT